MRGRDWVQKAAGGLFYCKMQMVLTLGVQIMGC